MSRALALTQLLTRIFSDEELRLHVASEPDAEVLTPILPGRMVPPMMFAAEVVTALERRGLLDRTFFDRLETPACGTRSIPACESGSS
jgi:hypothetical protein